MKTINLMLAILGLGCAVLLPDTSHADQWINGYTRSDGVYVRGHYRSDPDHTKKNNWSTHGNINPRTNGLPK